MPWTLSLPRLPFKAPFLLLSFSLAITNQILFNLDTSWQNAIFRGFHSVFIIAHHILMLPIFMWYSRDGTTPRFQNKRACKFYVRMLWVAFGLTFATAWSIAAMFGEGWAPTEPSLKRIGIAEGVVAGVEAVVLLLLIFTANYENGGAVVLPILEVEPSPNQPTSTQEPWPTRFFGSKYSLHDSALFSPWPITLSLVFTSTVLILSFLDGGSASFGLNPVTSTLYIIFAIFVILVYTDVTAYGSDTPESYIYRKLPQTLHFVRYGLRSVYLAMTCFAFVLFFIGGTISWYHWFHYCGSRYGGYSGCYLKAPSSTTVFFQALFAYVDCATVLVGMIIPPMIDLNVSFPTQQNNATLQEHEDDSVQEEEVTVRIASPTSPSPSTAVDAVPAAAATSVPGPMTPRSRLPFSPLLFILSFLLLAVSFLLGAANFDIKQGYGTSAMLTSLFLFIHHLLIGSIFTFIRDFDPRTYVPTLHKRAACRLYVWTLLLPIVVLVLQVAECVMELGRMRYGIALGCVAWVQAVVLCALIAMAKYAPYPWMESIPQGSIGDV